MISLLSDSSARELQRALENPNRRGSFRSMVRSGGRAIVPGSTVKGALRTGLLHLEFERRGVSPGEVLMLIEDRGRSGKASDKLQELAFSLSPRVTESDPMRDVAVADAVLDEESTQIDQVVDWKRDRSGEFNVPNQQFQLHVERLFSLADRLGHRRVSPISVSIAVRGSKVLGERRELERRSERLGPDRSPNFATLLQGVNAHHIAVWKLERQHLFSGPLGGDTAALLKSCLDTLGIGDIDTLERDEAPRRALIRLGWAGHFDRSRSKQCAADTVPRRRRTAAAVGSTRRGVMLGGVFVPFGWAALIPEEEAPANLAAIAAAGSTVRLGSLAPVRGAPSRDRASERARPARGFVVVGYARLEGMRVRMEEYGVTTPIVQFPVATNSRSRS